MLITEHFKHPVKLLLAGLTSMATSLAAQEIADKSRYHLFHPTPIDQMRPLSTDRPDMTESPYTVDAGHVQVETDLFNGTWDHPHASNQDVRVRSLSYGGWNFKVGLLNQVDLQTIWTTHTEEREKDRITGSSSKIEGMGDLTTRIKINLWGNDSGGTALALMPFVKWPLSASEIRNGKTEGGIVIPFALDLGNEWGLGAQSELDLVSDLQGGMDAEYFNTLTIGHPVLGQLGAYFEFASLVRPESDEDWQAWLNMGFTYAIGDNMQLDGGCNFGMTEATPDYNPFVGFTIRF